MPLSMKGLGEVRFFAKHFGISLALIRDPLGTIERFYTFDVQDVMHSASFTPDQIEHGYANHFPGYFIRKRGEFRLLRLGYMSIDDLQTVLHRQGCMP